jgi:AraC-like DNA-binding protein
MDLVVRTSRGALDRFIADVRVIRPRPGQTRTEVDALPNGTSCLLFRWHGGAAGDLHVRGPLTRAVYKTAPVVPLLVVVVFRPGGGYPFFGVPLGRLADEAVPLDALWGPAAAQLVDRLVAAQGDRATAAIVEQALLDRLRSCPYEPAAAVSARAAVRLLDAGWPSIAGLADELGVSERNLRRSFEATVGVTPKTYARIARFQRALVHQRQTARWSDVARHAGYFDQAHMIAEFHDLAGGAPTALRRPHDRRACDPTPRLLFGQT